MQPVVAAAGGFDYGLALIAAVLGSGHCRGMCGALVSGYFMNAGPTRSVWPYFVYQNIRLHHGRIFETNGRHDKKHSGQVNKRVNTEMITRNTEYKGKPLDY